MATLAPPPAAFLQGDYNPAGYVPGNPATYPKPKPPAVLYQPVMWWNSTGYGTMGGFPVKPGDYIFPVAGTRSFGAFKFGDYIFGGTGPRDWPAGLVGFVAYDHTLPAEKQPPWPNAGCPFGDYTGWRIVIDALYNDLVGSRTYGSLTYGDEVYGDVDGAKVRWADITQPTYQIALSVGTEDGAPTVPITEIGLGVLDDEGRWFDFEIPRIWYQPDLGTPIRVGFLDPVYRYHPIVIGEIVAIRDEHDTLPRYVEIGGVSRSTELVTTVAGWQRPAETASARFMALLAAAGWRWQNYSLVFPGDTMLHADAAPRDIIVLDELDRTVQSAGWYMDEDHWGGVRVRPWPHEPTGTPIVATDCLDDTEGELLSASMVFVRDQDQLLNVATLTNTEATPKAVTVEQSFSIARYGRRSEGMGWPLTGLAFANIGDAQAIAVRAVNRFAYTTRHVETLTADTDVDRNWLPALVDLDTGAALTAHRREISDMTLDNVVVGFTHLITPGRIETTINTSTLTQT